jgi:hypothetical protein
MKIENGKNEGYIKFKPENTLDAFRLGIIATGVGAYSADMDITNKSLKSLSVSIVHICDKIA